MTHPHFSTYWVYVLRFWPETNVNRPTAGQWRFTLENTATGARRGFATLKELVIFLENETREETYAER